ncbi:hypothetical protein SANA_26420 [Gottschalkiaceae bacterium SANA]|nr:hypothetical protein SANA_26420 [Gottschalkiaceae bacterium SANA]
MKKWLSVFMILLCIALLASGCTVDSEPVTETPVPVRENPAQELEERVSEIVEATKWRGAFLVTPLKFTAKSTDDSGVSADSIFQIEGIEPGSNLAAHLKFEPEIEYDVVWPANSSATITPKTALSAGEVYQVTYSSEEGQQSWAFQTQDEFRIKCSIPRDKATEVPLDAAIEWVFTRTNLVNIQSFVTIEPELAGQWRFDQGIWTFLPEQLEAGIRYEFTLAGDYGTDDGEILGEPVVMEFYTAQEEMGRPDTWIDFDEFYHQDPNEEWVLGIYGQGFDPGETFPVKIERYPELTDFLADVESQYQWAPWGYREIKGWVADDALILAEESMATIVGSSMGGSSFYLSIPDGLPEGNYRVTTEIEGLSYKTLVQVHPLQAMVEATDQELVFWAIDSETGQGLENLYVQTGEEIRRTDEMGTAIFRMDVDSESLLVLAKEEGKQPLVLALPQAWEQYDYSMWSGHYRNPEYYTTIFTDRGLYQPTDTIEGWGLVQSKEKVSLNRVSVILESWGSEPSIIASQKVDVDESGSFIFDFAIQDLLPQSYRIRVYDGETILMAHPLDVGHYVKPELVVQVETNKVYYESGEDVKLSMSCNFFEGTPAVGTELEVTYHDTEYHRETVVVDKNGKAELTVNPTVNEPTIYAQPIDFYVRTKDEQNKEVTDYANIQVFPRDIWVELAMEVDDDQATIDISNYALDLKKANGVNRTGKNSDFWGDPIDLDLTIHVVEIYWEQTSIRKQYDPIEKRMIEIPQYTKREKQINRIDFKGIEGGQFEFPVEKDKSYRVTVLTEDQQARAVKVDQSVNTYWGRPDDANSMYLDLEKSDWAKKYSIGETVKLTLTRGESPVGQMPENAQLLVAVYQNGIREIQSYETSNVEFDFNEQDLPNLYVQALYFDGKQFLRSMAVHVGFEESDRDLNIQVEANQERYEPGDTVTIDFSVADKDGNPVSANLYLAVVDEAYFAVRDQHVDPLGDLYRYTGYPNLTRSTASTDGGAYNLYGGAEGGGGGDSMVIRSDFKDTAIVQDLKTDADGRAQFSFVVPDNLTTWRLTTLGVTADLYAGSTTTPIEVSLPFFLQVIGSEEYVSGDMPMVGFRSYGSAQGTPVTHRISLKQNGEELYAEEWDGLVGQLTYLALPELKTGTYVVTMTSETANASDGIEKEIEVVDARNAAWVDFAYQPGDLFLYPYGELTIVPAEQGWLYREWRQLYHSGSKRVDARATMRLAQIQINQWMDEELEVIEPPFEYQQYDGGFGLVPYGESDPVLTAKLVASGLPITMNDKALAYLDRIREDQQDEISLAASLWGLASQGEPVLMELMQVRSKLISDQAKLYLALGFADLGADEEAVGIYEPMMRARAYTYGGQRTYLESDDFNQKRIDTMLAALLAVRLERPEAIELYNYAKQLPPINELNQLERALFLQEFKVDPTMKGRIEAVTPNQSIDRTIGVADFVTYLMSAEELAATDWRLVDHVDMSLSAHIPVKELYNSEDGVLGLKRSYEPAGKTLEDLGVGDVIQVRLRLQLDENAPKGGYVISDVLPSNLRFMDATKRSGEEFWISENGQQMTIHTWPKGKSIELTVLARVVAPGTYQAEPAFVQAQEAFGQLNTNLFGFSESQVIEVKLDEADSVSD